MNLKKWFLDLVTLDDNETHNLASWLGLLSFLHFHIMSAYTTFYLHIPFNYQDYGLGLGALFVTLGVLLRLDPMLGDKKDNGSRQ
jgi:hypothetical protein